MAADTPHPETRCRTLQQFWTADVLLPRHSCHQSHRILLIRLNCMFVEWNSTCSHTQISSPQASYGMLSTFSRFQMANIDPQNGDIYWGNPVTGTLIGTWHNGSQCSWASPGRTSRLQWRKQAYLVTLWTPCATGATKYDLILFYALLCMDFLFPRAELVFPINWLLLLF